MTDHKIHQHNQQGTTQNYKDKQNSEQNDQSVFALINFHIIYCKMSVTIWLCLFLIYSTQVISIIKTNRIFVNYYDSNNKI